MPGRPSNPIPIRVGIAARERASPQQQQPDDDEAAALRQYHPQLHRIVIDLTRWCRATPFMTAALTTGEDGPHC